MIDNNDFTVQFDIKTYDNDKSFLTKVGAILQDGNEYPAYYFLNTLMMEQCKLNCLGYLISGSTPINDNQWHNITVAFDRDDIASIYIDGVLDGQY